MREALEALLGVVEVGTWAILSVASVQLLRNSIWTLRAGPVRSDPVPAVTGDSPRITVQLPLRNERGRAEDLLRCVCALDWPKDRFEIQVLDDSDDETIAVVDEAAESLRAAGCDIKVIRRPEPRGYKAGALANGVSSAVGEYVAIFDADARPDPDCLTRLVAAISKNPSLAYVQARWSFDNESNGLLTRAQAMILDALFVGEQARLSTLGRPVQFNGTAGLWRRSALDAAGGWLGPGGAAASVTEDLALSFRVVLAQGVGATCADICVRTELPTTIAAFRRQQARWVRGSGEVLRALVRAIAGGRGEVRTRATMLGHLLRHVRQPWLLALTVLWPATLWVRPRLHVDWAWSVALLAVVGSMGLYFAAVRRRLGRSAVAGFLFAPVVMALSIGLCPVLTVAFLGGAFGQPAEFERTPKGDEYRPRSGGLFEFGLGAFYLVLAGDAALRGSFAAAVALLGLFAFGLLWIGTGAFGR
jgi:cellulose synthase/poly-beta-1,6-N-acetylglucosamine synthase-like glycosyltransferase